MTQKKMILARIIEKLIADRNDHMIRAFFITEDDFREKAAEGVPRMQIVEDKDGIWRPQNTHTG